MAKDINDYDVIVGATDAASGAMSAVRWDASGTSNLGTLPGGQFSHALAISNNFEIVGYSDDATPLWRPVRWDRFGGIKDLGTLPGDLTGQAWAISDETGDVVGYSEGFSTHAVLWPAAGGIKDLGVLPGGSAGQPASTSMGTSPVWRMTPAASSTPCSGSEAVTRSWISGPCPETCGAPAMRSTATLPSRDSAAAT